MLICMESCWLKVNVNWSSFESKHFLCSLLWIRTIAKAYLNKQISGAITLTEILKSQGLNR